MNSTRHKTNKLTAAIGLLVICSSMLVACGGDSSDTTAGIGGTGIVSGQITGFGSIHVNGGKFETDTSRFDVDGDTSADQSDLAVGMVVRLRVEVENGVFGNTALEVVYDDEIEGPLTNVMNSGPTIKTGTIFGKTITFDQASTIFVDTSFNTIGQNGDLLAEDVIEVSGFRTSETEIAATYVRFKEDLRPGITEVELRGLIKTLAGTPPDETFVIDNIGITTNIATELEVPNGMLVDGLYVEVEGVIQTPTSVLAEEVEQEDEDFDDDIAKISLEGVVSGFTNINSDFFVGSQRVNASTAELIPGGLIIADDLKVEVEGQVTGGLLIADEVEEE